MNLSTIKQKIKALSKMTIENGCTEAEAMVAAEKLSQLLDQHGLSLADVKAGESEETKLGRDEWTQGKSRLHDGVMRVATAIARLFDCKCWQNRGTLIYFGFPQDTAAAEAMTQLIHDAMEREWKAFKKEYGDRYDAAAFRRWRSSFITGMALRIRERLTEMKQQRAQRTSDSRALVVVKDQIVEAGFKEETAGLHLRARRSLTAGRDRGVRDAGYAAGSRVALSTGPGMTEARKIAA